MMDIAPYYRLAYESRCIEEKRESQVTTCMLSYTSLTTHVSRHVREGGRWKLARLTPRTAAHRYINPDLPFHARMRAFVPDISTPRASAHRYISPYLLFCECALPLSLTTHTRYISTSPEGLFPSRLGIFSIFFLLRGFIPLISQPKHFFPCFLSGMASFVYNSKYLSTTSSLLTIADLTTLFR